MRTGELKKVLGEKGIGTDMISKNRAGNMILRRGFFYRFGYDENKFSDAISKALTDAKIEHTIIDKGEYYTSFRGGAKLQNQSHWSLVQLGCL